MAKSEMSSKKTHKEVFQEISLWHVHSFHRVKTYSTFRSLEGLSLRILWKDVKWQPEACGDQGNVFHRKLERSFLSNFLWCLYSSHRVKSFFGLNSFKSLFLWNLRKDIWERSLEYPEKEITSDRNQKETFCETALCRVNSALTVKLLFSLGSILTLFLFSLRSDIQEHFEAYGENGNIFNRYRRQDFRGAPLWRVHSSCQSVDIAS